MYTKNQNNKILLNHLVAAWYKYKKVPDVPVKSVYMLRPKRSHYATLDVDEF
jgi:hypothetical protein